MDFNGRSLAWRAVDVNRSTPIIRPFPNPDQAERTRVADFFHRDAAAIVVYDQLQFVLRFREMHRHSRCCGVTSDVRQRFLENSEHGRRALRVEFEVMRMHRQVAHGVRVSRKFLCLPFNRGGESEVVEYAIRLPANDVLQQAIAPLLTRPVGRPSNRPVVLYADFLYQAQSWKRARRVVAKVEWHKGELFPRVGFIVTNLTRSAKQVVRFYNQRGTAEQCIKEGKNAVNWTRLSCHDFADNQVRLQLFVLAYNLGNFLRQVVLPRTVRHWTLTTLREKLIKIGAKVVRHARQVIFQMAEVAVPRELFRAILERIGRLRLPAPVSG